MVRNEIPHGASCDHASTGGAGAGTEVDDVVGARDKREVVLDHDDGGAAVDQPVEKRDEPGGVGEVQAGGGLVENVGGGRFLQARGEFEALALAAGQGGQRLAEGDIAEVDVDEVAAHLRRGIDLVLLEVRLRVLGGHREDVGDVLAAEGVDEHGVVETPAFADFAGHVDALHQPEVDVDDAGSLAVLARAVGVRREHRGRLAGGFRESLADRIEHAGESRGVGAAGAGDGGLVDPDGVVDKR